MTPVTSDAPTTGSRDPAKPPGGSRAGFSAWAALLVVWVVWGSTYLAIRVADRTIPPFPMAGVRYLTAGILLYPAAWLGTRRGPRPRARVSAAQWAGMAVVGTL